MENLEHDLSAQRCLNDCPKHCVKKDSEGVTEQRTPSALGVVSHGGGEGMGGWEVEVWGAVEGAPILHSFL